MLTVTVVREVERLLQSGVSQRTAARTLGVSRGSVHAIATGKRARRDPRRHAPEEPRIELPRGPLIRCPICGGLVRSPCLACQIRHLTGAKRIPGRLRADSRGFSRPRQESLASRCDRPGSDHGLSGPHRWSSGSRVTVLAGHWQTAGEPWPSDR